jgi:hypothetical protein
VWSDQGWWVQNTVIAYADVSGQIAVSQVKGGVERCQKYTAGNEDRTLLGPVQLPAYPGIDASYAYCVSARRTDSGSTYVSCLAFLGKGGRVSAVWAVHGGTQKTNTSGIISVAAVAAEALDKAA